MDILIFMKNKLWFKAKRYGWGWYPVSWEGWIIILIYTFIMVKIFLSIDMNSHSGSDTLINFAIPFIVLTSILLTICYKKGEIPGWHWGELRDRDPKRKTF